MGLAFLDVELAGAGDLNLFVLLEGVDDYFLERVEEALDLAFRAFGLVGYPLDQFVVAKPQFTSIEYTNLRPHHPWCDNYTNCQVCQEVNRKVAGSSTAERAKKIPAYGRQIKAPAPLRGAFWH